MSKAGNAVSEKDGDAERATGEREAKRRRKYEGQGSLVQPGIIAMVTFGIIMTNARAAWLS